jgi:hypothetical protein
MIENLILQLCQNFKYVFTTSSKIIYKKKKIESLAKRDCVKDEAAIE